MICQYVYMLYTDPVRVISICISSLLYGHLFLSTKHSAAYKQEEALTEGGCIVVEGASGPWILPGPVLSGCEGGSSGPDLPEVT